MVSQKHVFKYGLKIIFVFFYSVFLQKNLKNSYLIFLKMILINDEFFRRVYGSYYSSALSLEETCRDRRPLTVTTLSLADTVRLRGPVGFERPTFVVVVLLLGPEYLPP